MFNLIRLRSLNIRFKMYVVDQVHGNRCELNGSLAKSEQLSLEPLRDSETVSAKIVKCYLTGPLNNCVWWLLYSFKLLNVD